MTTFNENAQWERVNKRLSTLSDEDLQTFKRNEKSFNFATWSPSRFGMYYLKTMLTIAARSLGDEDFSLLDKVTNRTFGKPISVRVKGRDICLDYFQALYEAKYIGEIGHNVKRMIEIGAGFGRTCHTLLCLNPQIEEYVIIDLPGCLSLSQRYLKEVLTPEMFAKVKFVLNTECVDYLDSTPDVPTLAINCDSLGEMDKNVSQSYLNMISKHADFFYSCNPVAKYDPACMEELSVDHSLIDDALGAGLLTDAINVFDDDAVAQKISPYIEAMKPGPSWSVQRQNLAELYSYYVHVIYKSDGL